MIHRISMCKCDLIKFSNLFYDKIKFTLKKNLKGNFKLAIKKITRINFLLRSKFR